MWRPGYQARLADMREARSDHAQAGLRVCSGLATAGEPLTCCERLEDGCWREAGVHKSTAHAVAESVQVTSLSQHFHFLRIKSPSLSFRWNIEREIIDTEKILNHSNKNN